MLPPYLPSKRLAALDNFLPPWITSGTTSTALFTSLADGTSGRSCFAIWTVGSLLTRLIIAICRDANVLSFDRRVIEVMNVCITVRAKRGNVKEDECKEEYKQWTRVIPGARVTTIASHSLEIKVNIDFDFICYVDTSTHDSLLRFRDSVIGYLSPH
jgi:hypothetical protein